MPFTIWQRKDLRGAAVTGLSGVHTWQWGIPDLNPLWWPPWPGPGLGVGRCARALPPICYVLVREQVPESVVSAGKTQAFLVTSLRDLLFTMCARSSELENVASGLHSMQIYGTNCWNGSYTQKTDVQSQRTRPGSVSLLPPPPLGWGVLHCRVAVVYQKKLRS